MISLVASAVRPNLWKGFMKSLEGTKVPYEVIFVGNVAPIHYMENFTWVNSDACPAECYSLGFKKSRGVMIHWTSDDALYYPGSLDVIWSYAQSFPYKNLKTIYEPLLYENYGGGWRENSRTQRFNAQRFSPLMAPFGFMSKEWFNELGGYDKNFSHGQAENDLVMRAREDGGRVKIIQGAEVWVDHTVHGGREGTNFSKGYLEGRRYLESCWIRNGRISKKRLKPLELFI